MASGFSGQDENTALDARVLNWGSTCQLAISTTEATWDDTVTTGSTAGLTTGSFTEVTGASYARVIIPTASWAAAANRLKSNSSNITFPAPTDDWGYGIQYMVIFDSTGNDAVAMIELDIAIDILNGATAPNFPAGTITLSHEL